MIMLLNLFGVKCGTGSSLLMFVLFTLSRSTQAFKEITDMNWKKNPAEAWPYSIHQVECKVVILLLNIENYIGDNKEWKFIASGILLDNSRILTSYNPFKQLIRTPDLTDKIVALLVTGRNEKLVRLKIANIVCGRQIAYAPDDGQYKSFWSDKENSPIHDLMVIRIEEELGIANASMRQPPIVSGINYEEGNWHWSGQVTHDLYYNSLVSFPARLADALDPDVLIFTLGYLTKKDMKDYDTIHEIAYEADDAAVVDCDEWLPRQWGFFICIRNIGNFPGLGSGATLFSNNKLFGIGSFAMFKNDTGIFVFTDVRPYEELIEKTCDNDEFN